MAHESRYSVTLYTSLLFHGTRLLQTRSYLSLGQPEMSLILVVFKIFWNGQSENSLFFSKQVTLAADRTHCSKSTTCHNSTGILDWRTSLTAASSSFKWRKSWTSRLRAHQIFLCDCVAEDLASCHVTDHLHACLKRKSTKEMTVFETLLLAKIYGHTPK